MDILPQLLVNALIAGSIYALASAGLSLTYGLLRVLNFAHGHFMMLGAYLFYAAYVDHRMGLFAAGVTVAALMMVAAGVSMAIFIKPFLPYSPLLPFVTTLALSAILEALVSIYFGVNVKSLSLNSAVESIEIWGVFITPLQIGIILSAVVLLGLLAVLVHTTSLGRTMRGIAENPHAAEALGVSRGLVSRVVFVGGILLAAFAGIMVGFETNLQPTMGNTYTIKAFAAMILGGLGNIWGTMIASYILGLIENLSIGLDFNGISLPAGYKDAFSFIIILFVLLVRPEGLFNFRNRRA